MCCALSVLGWLWLLAWVLGCRPLRCGCPGPSRRRRRPNTLPASPRPPQTIKLGVQYSLWGGSVLSLGTERHHKQLLDDIDRLRLPGCFASARRCGRCCAAAAAAPCCLLLLLLLVPSLPPMHYRAPSTCTPRQ